MFDDDDSASADDTQAQPDVPGSLSNGQRFVAMAKHVLGKALKWGLIAAVVTGVLAAIPGLGVSGILYTLSAGTIGSGAAEAGIGAALSTGMTMGLVGAAVGGLLGLTSASDAADNANEESIFNYNRRLANAQQQQMVQQRYQQQQMAMAQQASNLGISAPNTGLNRGHGQLPGVG